MGWLAICYDEPYACSRSRGSTDISLDMGQAETLPFACCAVKIIKTPNDE